LKVFRTQTKRNIHGINNLAQTLPLRFVEVARRILAISQIETGFVV
jgi:hypothetical protein